MAPDGNARPHRVPSPVPTAPHMACAVSRPPDHALRCPGGPRPPAAGRRLLPRHMLLAPPGIGQATSAVTSPRAGGLRGGVRWIHVTHFVKCVTGTEANRVTVAGSGGAASAGQADGGRRRRLISHPGTSRNADTHVPVIVHAPSQHHDNRLKRVPKAATWLFRRCRRIELAAGREGVVARRDGQHQTGDRTLRDLAMCGRGTREMRNTIIRVLHSQPIGTWTALELSGNA